MMVRVRAILTGSDHCPTNVGPTMIEPILMVVLAVVAGGIVGAILFPIYALVSKIGA